ncbi:MAG: hypothetical protein AAB353_14385 [Candidatus Hydrogenedentota bacterium]
MFKKSGDSLLRAGLKTMIQAGLGDTAVDGLVRQLRMADKTDLAIDVYTQFAATVWGTDDAALNLYKLLKENGRREEGIKLLEQRYAAIDKRAAIAPLLLRTEQFELFWDLYPNPEAGPNPEFIWLFRAAGAAAAGVKNDPHYDELIAYFTPIGKGYYHDLGRILMGIAPEESGYALVSSEDSICEMGYYLGMRALGEGRIADAVRWMRVAVETRRESNSEWHLAIDYLYRIANKSKNLELLSTQDIVGS